MFKIIITGDNADVIAALLRDRLAEPDNEALGALHVECNAPATASADVYGYAAGAHDTPPFAVEKILDGLAERGWIRMDAGNLSPEEEEQIRARLQGLGYVD